MSIRRPLAFRCRPAAAVALAALALSGCGEPAFEPGEAAPQSVRVESVRSGPHAPTLKLMGRLEPAGSISLVAPVSGIVSYPPRFAGGLRAGETVSAGETVATFVRLGVPAPWFTGMFGNTAAAVVSTAASAGIVAIAPPEQNISSTR